MEKNKNPEYRPARVEFINDKLVITTAAHTVLEYPLSDFSWLENATEAQRMDFETSGCSIYWIELDDGLDLEYLIDWHSDKAKGRGFKATDKEWEALKEDAELVGKGIAEYLLDLAADIRTKQGKFFPRNPKRQGAPKGAANGRWAGTE